MCLLSTCPDSYPSRRCQKTEGTRILDSVLVEKLSPANRRQALFLATPPEPRPLGVNAYDVTMLVRRSGVNRPDSRGAALLSSVPRATSDTDLAETYAVSSHSPPVVKFREPITVA